MRSVLSSSLNRAVGAPWRVAPFPVLILCCLAMAAGPGCARQPSEKDLLREVYTPGVTPPPPHEPQLVSLEKLRDDLRSPRGQQLVAAALPDQAGALWLALLLALAIAFDFDHPRNPRNVDLLLMQAVGLSFFNIMGFFNVLQSPTYRNLMDWVFSAVFLLNLALLVRALRRVSRPASLPWRPNLDTRPLIALTLLLLALNVFSALVRTPDDAGWFINLGAQRLRERFRFPYGDPLLTNTPAAAYGPLLYIAHLPFQLMLSPAVLNPVSPARPPLGSESTYLLPPLLATKLCIIAFHLIGVAVLARVGSRLGGARYGWAFAAMYCGSAYVLGVGGYEFQIGGITFASHIAPAAVTMLAFATLARPALSGALLAIGGGIGFYPVFMMPAWLGHYWHERADRRRFLMGFILTALLIGGLTLALSRPANGRGRIGTILHDTLGHHSDLSGYGSSPFGFWGQRGGVRLWMIEPLVADAGFTSPAFLIFLALAGGTFASARRSTPQQLALVVAAVATAASILKIHSTGTYVAWAYPFFLLGFFGQASPAAAAGRRVGTPPAEAQAGLSVR